MSTQTQSTSTNLPPSRPAGGGGDLARPDAEGAARFRELDKCVAVFDDRVAADRAVTELIHAGLSPRQISIVGRGYHTDERATGFVNLGDRVKFWSKQGAFWGGLFGVLFAPAAFLIPGVGPILTGGIVGSALAGILEGGVVGAAAGAGISALGAGLVGLGIPRDSVVGYERHILADKYLLFVHGSRDDARRAYAMLAVQSPEVFLHDGQ